jgi:hypothetical protein
MLLLICTAECQSGCARHPRVEIFPFYNVGGTLSFRYLGMVFYRTLKMAKSAELAFRLFL